MIEVWKAYEMQRNHEPIDCYVSSHPVIFINRVHFDKFRVWTHAEWGICSNVYSAVLMLDTRLITETETCILCDKPIAVTRCREPNYDGTWTYKFKCPCGVFDYSVDLHPDED